MWSTRTRLVQDLERWRRAGWVTEDGARAIRAELDQRGPRFGLSGVLATLAAVLLGFAAMSFVAANWQDMSKLSRLVLLGGAMVGAYAAADTLFARRMESFAHAALLAGVAIFGAAIMLIAQMYHIDGHPPDAVLTWAAGAALTGALSGSSPVLGAAMLLVGLWSGWETGLREGVHWWFLPAWALLTLVMVAVRWSGGLVLAGLVLAVWVIALGYLLNDGRAHELVVLAGLAAVGAGGALETRGKAMAIAPATVVGLGLATAFAGALALQFVVTQPLPALVTLAAITIATLLAAVAWGVKSGDRLVLWLGYAGFSIEMLALYFKTVGTLLGSSLFFLVMGLLVAALAWFAWRLAERDAGAGGKP